MNFGLLTVDDEDLIELAKHYSKLMSKYHYDHKIRGMFRGKMRFYTKELKARGISWRVGGAGK